ncbi:hypothetical protein JCM17823_07110 [Halorubrum gandharaense]
MRNRWIVVLIALSVLLGAAVATAAATSGNVELDEALDDQSESETLSFTFTASEDGTVSATDTRTTSGGDVEFVFSSWSGGGSSGTSTSWSVEEGEQYTVEYTATAESGASETTHSESVGVEHDDGTTEASETLSLAVDYVEPAFGTINDQSTEVVFVDDDSATTTVEVDMPNVGDGVMDVTDVVFEEHDGVDASVDSRSDLIDGNSNGDLTTEIAVDDSVDAGSYSVGVTVSDNLGNSETFTVSLEVQKPPVAGVSGDEIDVGDVLVGTSEDVEFTVDELGGNEGLDGLDIETVSADPNADIGFDIPFSFGTSPGGSGEATVTVDVSDDASQHDDIEVDALISGTDDESPDRDVTVNARVIFPATLGNVRSTPGTFSFDEPRDEVSSQTHTTTVDIPNDGDLEMEVDSVDASVSQPGISATVVDAPGFVDGQESRDAEVVIEADPSVSEETYELEIAVETDDAGSETITRDFDVEHETELAVSSSEVRLGEVTITESVTRSVDVSERLGYNDLENVEVTLVDGPDDWLEASGEPTSTVRAGDSSELRMDLLFDTEAEAYQQYVWTFEVDADGVDSEEVEVVATARLLSVEDIVTGLEASGGEGGWQADAADGVTEGLTDLETRLREGESVDDGDIQRSLTVAQTTIVLIDRVGAAGELQAEDDYEAAQPNVVSALVARELIDDSVSEITDQETASDLEVALEESAEPLEEIVAEQESHYQAILEDDDASALAQYQASTSLESVYALQGDDAAAADHEEIGEERFSSYQIHVEDGVEHRQSARSTLRDLEDEATLTVLGQPLVLNPTRYDEVASSSDSILENYDDAATNFENAGATAEAEATDAEASQAALQLQITQYTLLGAGAGFGVVFLYVVIRQLLNARLYVREARMAETGGFLR